MKKIKPGEYLHKVCTCGSKAQWRSSEYRLPARLFACDAHQAQIIDAEREVRAKFAEIDGHMSEADHQTWCRL